MVSGLTCENFLEHGGTMFTEAGRGGSGRSGCFREFDWAFRVIRWGPATG